MKSLESNLEKVKKNIYSEEANKKAPSKEDIEQFKEFRKTYIETFNKVQKRFMEGKLRFDDIEMEFGKFRKETYTDFQPSAIYKKSLKSYNRSSGAAGNAD